jgi:hypothetical protein
MRGRTAVAERFPLPAGLSKTNEGRPRCEAHLIMLQRYGASAAHARSSDTAPRSPTPACGAYPCRPVVTYSDSPGARSSSGSPPTSRKVTADSCPGMGEHIDVLKRSLNRFDVRVVLGAPWCYTSEAVMVDTRTTRRPVGSGGQRRIAYRPILSVTVTWGGTPPPPAPAPPAPRRGPGPRVPGDCPREGGPPAAGSPPS